MELAGEIRERYKDKEDEKSLTVLNAGERLLSNVRLGTSLQDGARSELERKGVKVRMGEERARKKMEACLLPEASPKKG